MGANHQLDAAVLQGAVELLFLPGLHRARQQRHGDVGRLQQLFQGVVVLGGQNFRGGHKGRLHPLLDDGPAQGGGHGGFAAAHVPLDEPVHGGGARHVRHGFPNGPALGPRQLEGQQAAEALGELLGDGVEVVGFPPAFYAQQPQLQHQEFLKGQPEPGGGNLLLRLGEVDGLQGVAQGAQVVLLPQRVGQGVVELLGEHGQGVFHRRPNLPGGEPRRGRVHRLDGELLCLGQELRGQHLPPQEGAGDLPPEEVGFPFPQQGGYVLVVEKGQGHVAVAVGDGGLVQQLAALHPVLRGPPQDCGLHHRHLVEGGVPDEAVLAPVLVGAGVKPEQIPHRGDAQLAEELGPLGPHALAVLNIQFKQGGHGHLSFLGNTPTDKKKPFRKERFLVLCAWVVHGCRRRGVTLR